MSRYGCAIAILVVALAGCGSTEPPVSGGKSIDHWLELASDSKPQNRVLAIQKLGNIGDKDSSAIDAIVEALDDREPGVRKAAIYAVVRVGAGCRAAFPKLEEMSQEDTVAEIRALARESFENLAK